MKKRVLIITFHFPPRETVASLRLKGLAKYLPEFGWEPFILVPTFPEVPPSQFIIAQAQYPGDVSSVWKRRLGFKTAKSFQEQIGVPRSLRESRSSYVSTIVDFFKAIVFFPDEQKYWHTFAVKAGQELLRQYKFDTILSSSSPVTCHLIANTLCRKFDIPWVADLRDLWSQNHYNRYPFLRSLIERRLELRTLEAAKALVTVSVPLAEKLRELHVRKPVFAIPNGFDPDDVATEVLTPEFTITYTGQLYQGKRDPALLFQVLSTLIEQKVIEPTRIKIRFYGDTPYWLEQEIEQYGLEEVVSLNSTVPRTVSLVKQRESQVLLLLNWDNPQDKGVYTGKLFEYLAAKRPILAVGGPGGVVAELLSETGVGVHVNTFESLREIFLAWYKEYKEQGAVSYKGDWTWISKYDHRNMSRSFAKVLNYAMGQ